METKSRIASASLLVIAAVSCSSPATVGKEGEDLPDASGGASGSSDAGGKAGTGGGAGWDGGLFGDGKATECTEHEPCDGGVCVGGACCAIAQACGEACCKVDETCFANACVVPGKICHAAADCDPGQYCELGLGTQPGPGDGGSSDATVESGSGPDAAGDGGGPVCLEPVPAPGRCLTLPPECPSNTPDAGPPDCLLPCEYHPPSGKLDAVVKWSWGPTATQFPNHTDVWSTPTVGRLYDTNCDGKVDELDPPNVVFVSGDTKQLNCGNANGDPDSCRTGVLRVLDGRSGHEIWSLRKASASSVGFMGLSLAIGDLDTAKPGMEIAAITGEGYLVIIDGTGKVLRTSDKVVPGSDAANFGWGGGLAIGDMNGDGAPEISYGATVYTTANGKLTQVFHGTLGKGGESVVYAMSALADIDGDGDMELVAGTTAYDYEGKTVWNRADLADGFPAIADLDGDTKPEVILVSKAKMYILNGATGATRLGPFDIPGVLDPVKGAHGGPPTVADFDGDGKREIGVAVQTFYSVLKPDFVGKKIDVLWKMESHDLSSSQTGSTVFDFEGDGKAEVIYADECFLWVFDGANKGQVKFVASHSSFTADEASLVADVDGDGHAEMIMVSNSASPLSWKCIDAQNVPTKVNGVTWEPGPTSNKGYRGLKVFADKANSWVGTRALWNQHTYHVNNICDDRDSACKAPNVYGSIPKEETENWNTTWLNNYRQNVQDKGLFNAPDATVLLEVQCVTPVVLDALVRNLGSAILPAGVQVDFYHRQGNKDTLLGSAATVSALFPGQVGKVTWKAKPGDAVQSGDLFFARVDPKKNPTFHECREGNNESAPSSANCVVPK
ncbi:MAG: VCBS repeat-containing protein [Deltaproteobacteria bacterium]|nr:VCBS repeat-containing protein [Deltaproteobacteria bacterium]